MKTHTAKSIAEAALKLHAEGRLIAQNPKLTTDYAAGDPRDCRCAVGADLDPEELQAIEAAQSAGRQRLYFSARNLQAKKLVTFATDQDARDAGQLQAKHDRWATSARRGYPTRAANEAEFLKACRELSTG